MLLDIRVRQMCYIIKNWAKNRKINDPFRGTLSSYCYVMMIIHFCQVQQPPILPSLQAINRKQGDSRLVAGYDVCFEPLTLTATGDQPIRRRSPHLIALFFRYFAYDFDYHSDVICVYDLAVSSTKRLRKRNGHRVVNETDILLSVEDPFETTHDLGRVCDKEALYGIRYETKPTCKAAIPILNND